MIERIARRPMVAALVALLVASACASGSTSAPVAPDSALNDTPTTAQAPSAAQAPTAAQAPAATQVPTATPVPQAPPVPTVRPAAATNVGASNVVRKKCPADIAEGWRCITLTLPLDHFSDTGRTIDVTFAIMRHSGSKPAKGTFVTITGGPGSAGIYSAASYSDPLAPAVWRDYDLVFMDQRGSGMSGGFACPNSSLAWFRTQAGPNDPDGGAAVMAAAHTFVDDCLAESEVDQSILPYLGTRQAIEDLEAFRQWLGVDKLDLYGESYGTQFAQSYAAIYPDHIKRLYLDGPVDLTLSGPDYYVEAAQAYEQDMLGTLLDCTVQSECSRDVNGGNALTTYDALAAQLREQPIEYTYTFADGHQEQRLFTATDLENAVLGSAGGLSSRRLLQRAMGPASHGSVWWLARLAAGTLGEEPDDHTPIIDPSWSDALYYAVECVDYEFFPDAGTPDDRARAYIEFGREHGVFERRNTGDFLGDLPCVYWPAQPGPDPRPTPEPDAPYPVIVMGSSTDPATPFGNAQRIFDRRGDNPHGTWLIYWPGGPHVIFGRYLDCPDNAVTNILIKNKYPRRSILTCPGDMVADYVRTPEDVQIVEDGPRGLLARYDDELNYGVDYWWWAYEDDLKFGCAFGGTIEYRITDVGSKVILDECSFVEGSAASGNGVINDFTGGFRLKLRFTGDWSGRADYRRAPSGAVSLTGNIAYAGDG